MDSSTAASCADILQVAANGSADTCWNSYYFIVKHWYVDDPKLAPMLTGFY